jgi:glyoxylase-like metal-dependent hydrolase (beta-lactamase superfamily II)
MSNVTKRASPSPLRGGCEVYLGTWSGYSVSTIILSRFTLDGGAMCGPFPRALWERAYKPYPDHTIPLVARSLLIEGNGHCLLLDLGLGDAWSEKERKIFHIENTPCSFINSLTGLVFTHLHFDHAAGLLSSPHDTTHAWSGIPLYVQRENYEEAKTPHIKERASYRPSVISSLFSAPPILLDGDIELFPNLHLRVSHGHTRGLQWLEVSDPSKGSLLFPTDLIPMSLHLHPVCHTAYDMNSRLAIIEKEALLIKAASEECLVVYQHDPITIASYIKREDSGRFTVKNPLLAGL